MDDGSGNRWGCQWLAADKISCMKLEATSGGPIMGMYVMQWSYPTEKWVVEVDEPAASGTPEGAQELEDAVNDPENQGESGNAPAGPLPANNWAGEQARLIPKVPLRTAGNLWCQVWLSILPGLWNGNHPDATTSEEMRTVVVDWGDGTSDTRSNVGAGSGPGWSPSQTFYHQYTSPAGAISSVPVNGGSGTRYTHQVTVTVYDDQGNVAKSGGFTQHVM